MTYEEALYRFIDFAHNQGVTTDIHEEMVATIKEALEKQMLKKSIFTEHILIKGCKPSEMRSCPNCKRFFDVTMIGDDFCKRCGQAIDWSDMK